MFLIHRSHRDSKVLIIAALALGISTAAHAGLFRKSTLEIPEELVASSDDYPVTRRVNFRIPKRKVDNALVFGDWKVNRFREGWPKGSTTGVGVGRFGVEHTESLKKFSFRLDGPQGQAIFVECAKSGEERAITYKTERRETAVTTDWHYETVCGFSTIEGAEPSWRLDFDELTSRGTLIGPEGESIAVAPSGKVAGTRFEMPTPAGYFLLQEDRPAAAVDILNKGRLVLRRDGSDFERALWAATGAALLFRENL